MAIELHAGFVVRVEPEDAATRAELARGWPALRSSLSADAAELQCNYTDVDSVDADDVWRHFVEPTLRRIGRDAWELECTFAWQSDDDAHTVTFYIEGWESKGCAIDG